MGVREKTGKQAVLADRRGSFEFQAVSLHLRSVHHGVFDLVGELGIVDVDGIEQVELLACDSAAAQRRLDTCRAPIQDSVAVEVAISIAEVVELGLLLVLVIHEEQRGRKVDAVIERRSFQADLVIHQAFGLDRDDQPFRIEALDQDALVLQLGLVAGGDRCVSLQIVAEVVGQPDPEVIEGIAGVRRLVVGHQALGLL